MKARKLIAAVLAVTVCGALTFAGIAVASGANTRVTIQAQQGGFFGFVHTKKSASEKCENGRKVILYKQKGSEQKPRDDTKIGTDIAQPNGPDSSGRSTPTSPGSSTRRPRRSRAAPPVSATRSTRSRPLER